MQQRVQKHRHVASFAQKMSAYYFVGSRNENRCNRECRRIDRLHCLFRRCRISVLLAVGMNTDATESSEDSTDALFAQKMSAISVALFCRELLCSL